MYFRYNPKPAIFETSVTIETICFGTSLYYNIAAVNQCILRYNAIFVSVSTNCKFVNLNVYTHYTLHYASRYKCTYLGT